MWIASAWDKVKSSTIDKCFIHAGFILDYQKSIIIEENKNCPESCKEVIVREYSNYLHIETDIIVLLSVIRMIRMKNE